MTRIKELMKTVLICVLLVSTGYLTYLTWMYDPQLRPFGVTGSTVKVETHGVHTFNEAARPVRSAVTMKGGRYGLEYDPTAMDLLYNRVSTTVGEALGSASAPEKVTITEWTKALESEGVYFDFLGEIPLSALALWQETEVSSDTGISARRFILSAVSEDVVLYYIDEATAEYFSSVTAVKSESLMEKVGSMEPNGCMFAFEVSKDGDRLGARADTMVFVERLSIRQAEIMEVVADEPLFSNIAEAFWLNPYSNNSYTQQNGTKVAIDNTRSLILTKNGTAVYYDSLEEPSNGPSVYLPGFTPNAAEVIEKVREIIELTAGANSGDAQLYLDNYSYDQRTSKYTVRFSYSLSGAPVFLENQPYAAYFEIQSGFISYARIELRTFILADRKERPMMITDADLLARADRASGYELGIGYTEKSQGLYTEWYRR